MNSITFFMIGLSTGWISMLLLLPVISRGVFRWMMYRALRGFSRVNRNKYELKLNNGDNSFTMFIILLNDMTVSRIVCDIVEGKVHLQESYLFEGNIDINEEIVYVLKQHLEFFTMLDESLRSMIIEGDDCLEGRWITPDICRVFRRIPEFRKNCKSLKMEKGQN